MVDHGGAGGPPGAGGGGGGHHDRSHIPKWGGNPLGWKLYSQEVKMWQLGESLNVSYVVSARLVGVLSGPACRACMRMTREQLYPAAESRSQSNESGIKVVLKHLEDSFCQKSISKKGEVLSEFIAGHKAHRRRGERISDWLMRYTESIDAVAASASTRARWAISMAGSS